MMGVKVKSPSTPKKNKVQSSEKTSESIAKSSSKKRKSEEKSSTTQVSQSISPATKKKPTPTQLSEKKQALSEELDPELDPSQIRLASLLHQAVLEVFRTHYNKFTDVQLKAAVELLSHNDVIVESPTGSGKTLAFILPLCTIMRKKAEKWKPTDVGGLILSPTRELAMQTARVAQAFADALGYRVVIAIGGKKRTPAQDLAEVKKGCNVLIATPGRLQQLLALDRDATDMTLQRGLKAVELLIIDEADRFTEAAFSASMNDILAVIPKQRRTGLFSATQAKERDDLIKFTLRSPVTIKLKEQQDIVCPSTLKNFYAVCEAELKLITLLEFIRNKQTEKFIVFLSSCECVAYFAQLFPRLLKKRPLFAVHGKQAATRSAEIEKFRKSEAGIMLCTDVLSRGIDIDDIDWVVQFDVPRTSSWFVHRAGRTARCGREGSALLLLTPQETAYVQFVEKYEKVKLEQLHVKSVTPLKGQQLRDQIRKFATTNREILLNGTRAFVSFIEAYKRHDCHIVCGLKDLDIPGLAHAYGLLRLPKMAELGGREDLDKFKRSNVDTSTIKFVDASKEKKRKEIQAQKMGIKAQRKEAAKTKAEKRERKRKSSTSSENKSTPSSKKIKFSDDDDTEGETKPKNNSKDDKIKDDKSLLRKIKGGRLSKKDLKTL